MTIKPWKYFHDKTDLTHIHEKIKMFTRQHIYSCKKVMQVLHYSLKEMKNDEFKLIKNTKNDETEFK